IVLRSVLSDLGVFNLQGDKPGYVFRIYRETLSRFSCALHRKIFTFCKKICRKVMFFEKRKV
ncbi:hypothetical protein AAHB54_26210, partial [Bacillus cereus]